MIIHFITSCIRINLKKTQCYLLKLVIFLLLCKITKKNNQVESYRHSFLLDIINSYVCTYTY